MTSCQRLVQLDLDELVFLQSQVESEIHKPWLLMDDVAFVCQSLKT